jgi:hypothetical protein
MMNRFNNLSSGACLEAEDSFRVRELEFAEIPGVSSRLC